MGGARSLADIRRRTYRRSDCGRGKGIHAADDIATAPLSREDCEALSYLVKVPLFSALRSGTVFRSLVTPITRLQHQFVVYLEASTVRMPTAYGRVIFRDLVGKLDVLATGAAVMDDIALIG